jgi:hypothetical protein
MGTPSRQQFLAATGAGAATVGSASVVSGSLTGRLLRAPHHGRLLRAPHHRRLLRASRTTLAATALSGAWAAEALLSGRRPSPPASAAPARRLSRKMLAVIIARR